LPALNLPSAVLGGVVEKKAERCRKERRLKSAAVKGVGAVRVEKGNGARPWVVGQILPLGALVDSGFGEPAGGRGGYFRPVPPSFGREGPLSRSKSAVSARGKAIVENGGSRRPLSAFVPPISAASARGESHGSESAELEGVLLRQRVARECESGEPTTKARERVVLFSDSDEEDSGRDVLSALSPDLSPSETGQVRAWEEARWRDAASYGDRDRGRNQERTAKAVLETSEDRRSYAPPDVLAFELAMQGCNRWLNGSLTPKY
jgi:hypothetical protein